MTVYAITDTKKGRTGIAPTYLQTTPSYYYYYYYPIFVSQNQTQYIFIQQNLHENDYSVLL